MSSSQSSTAIIGAGIIGLSTAYYLSRYQDPSSIHIIEASPELFSSASGYAGGFLAKDWFAPPLAKLGILSFNEHRRLAEENGGEDKWGYSSATCISYAASAVDRDSAKRGDDWLRDGTSRADAAPVILDDSNLSQNPGWLKRREGDRLELISDEGTTAQVDPLRLCQFLLEEVVKRGVMLHHPAKAVAVCTDGEGKLNGVRVLKDLKSGGDGTESVVHCDKVVITAGVWTGKVFEELFPTSNIKVPVRSLAGHSLVLRSPTWDPQLEKNGCHAVFTTNDSQAFCPEMFFRVGGHLYFAGLNSSTIPIPDAEGGKAKPHPDALASLRTAAADILGASNSGGEDDLIVVREGLCFRPVTPWGHPIISRIDDRELGSGVATKGGSDGGVYVASGHGPWGISQSLGTGIVLSEMVAGRATSVDVSGLGLR
ncbi:FAD dependent oxidoreductase [Cladorrhinum samala]|uniref:FAD dependent oxidoreductase n=1 Tax=Cladorrhinum samala TaxID=585594 RepID=A0AAV9I1Q0_9PEZI|nr:FAD dependent oxidoreductase [Cladorrhinum samala]